MNAEQQRLHDAIAKRLTDDGRLVEVGWQAMRMFVIPPNAPHEQLTEMRKAFFLGAQHVFATITAIIDSDREPTAADLARMENIHNELEAFRMEVTSVHQPGRG